MSFSDDEEALFDDIYADDDSKKDILKKSDKGEELAIKQSAGQKEDDIVKKESSEETKDVIIKDENVKEMPKSDAEANANPSSSNSDASNSTVSQSTSLPQDNEVKEEVEQPQQIQQQQQSNYQQQQQQQSNQHQQQQSNYQQQHNRQQYQGGDPSQPLRADLSRDAGKMFIGGLDWDTDEDGLKKYFSQFGEVIDHTIMREPSTGRSRGFGFLTFADKSSVDEVVKRQHMLDGKVIDPKRAIPREEQDKTGKIFVGGIPPTVTPQEFEKFFAKYGTIIDAQLMLDKDTGRSRGFGFVTFDSPDAVDRVCQGKYIPFGNRQIEVKRAEPRGPQQQQNHIAAQQQRYLQQHQQQGFSNFNSTNAVAGSMGTAAAGLPFTQAAYGGIAGVTPEQMTEYYQKMTQYWNQLQQNGALGQQMAQYAQFQQQQAQAMQGQGQGQTQGQTQSQQPQQPQQSIGSSPSISNANDPAITNGSNSNTNNSVPVVNMSSGFHNNGHSNDLPKGPRNGFHNNNRNGYGGGFKGRKRGGYNKRGGYHPYSRN